MDGKLRGYYIKRQKFVDGSLKEVLPKKSGNVQDLYDSMSYSVMAGGKRLRPILLISGAEICGLAMEKVKHAACAMELIHTYSLIHDDLPAMDNDDFRRGRPTNHKKYGEALAILAGDALLTYAFELFAKNATILELKHNKFYDLISLLARSAGFGGMVGGQAADMSSTGRGAASTRESQIRDLDYIHNNKTAALISSSVVSGAILAGASPKKVALLERFGRKIGVSFQIMDDILDETKTAEELGKSNSDKKNEKLTFPMLYGREDSLKKALKLVKDAKKSLSAFGSRAAGLGLLADYIISRSK